MEPKLVRGKNNLYYFDKDRKYCEGQNPLMLGNCSRLRGDCSGLWGDCSGLSGNCTGLFGDCTGLLGNIDDCQLNHTERDTKINIEDLVVKE